ncbi:MAG: T9SS type A sorting domain-containing protein [Candidatus Eisenbacteria bacterium]|nr:T9SS type A sorting domain-containing protein [Candidatus Eisenbacteria bacterium]
MVREEHSVGIVLSAALILAAASPAAEAALQIDWFTVDGGGSMYSLGGPLNLGGTCGQPDAGVAGGGGLTLYGGFWHGGAAPVSDLPENPGAGEVHLAYRLQAGFPNPFRDETSIHLQLPEPQAVSIRIFDYSGRLLRRLHDGMMPAGIHQFAWDGAADSGRRVPSGLYVMEIIAGVHREHRRIVLLR